MIAEVYIPGNILGDILLTKIWIRCGMTGWYGTQGKEGSGKTEENTEDHDMSKPISTDKYRQDIGQQNMDKAIF